MADVLECTLVYNHFANASGEEGDSEDQIALVGRVRVIPQTTNHKPLLDPASNTGRTIRPFVGYLDSDGVLKNKKDGTPGLKIWANDPILNVSHLYYQVVFELVDSRTMREVKVGGGYFEAPSTAVTVELADVLQPTGSTIVGTTRKITYTEDIPDFAAAVSAAVVDAVQPAVDAAINNLVAGAPAALNTLDELAAALGDDANYAASVTTALGGKVDKVAIANRIYGTDASGLQAAYTVSGGADAGTVALRNTGGVLFTGNPTAAGHATTKTYVDTLGQTKVDRVSTANRLYGTDSGGAQTTYPFTASPTAATFMARDGSGRAQVAEPSASSDIATKNYADGKVAKSATAVAKVYGTTSAGAETTYAMGADITTAATVVQRNGTGQYMAADPTSAQHVATKNYVDGLVGAGPMAEFIQDTVAAMLVAGSNVDLNYNDVANTLTITSVGGGSGGGATNLTVNLTSGSVTVLSDTGTDAVIPPVDATNAGVMTPAMKTILDTVTSKVTQTATANRVYVTDGSGAQSTIGYSAVSSASTIAMRDGNSRIKAASPSASDDVATKGYVDGVDATLVPASRTINGQNLSANRTFTQDAFADGTTNKAYTATEKTKLDGIATGATANSSDATLLARANHTGTQSADTLTDGSTNRLFSSAEKTKLSGIATGATANSTDATLLARANHTGTQSADTVVDGTTNKAFTATEKTKLSGIATGATANSSDATLLSRANHTGTQAASTITMATARLLGRNTAGSGAAEEISLGSNLSFSGTTLNAVFSGGFSVNPRAAVVTASATLAAGDVAQVNSSASGATVTLTMPSAPADGTLVGVQIIDVGQQIVLTRGGTDEFSYDGSAVSSVVLYSSGTNRVVLSLWRYESTGGFWHPITYYALPASTDLIDSSPHGRAVLTSADTLAARNAIEVWKQRVTEITSAATLAPDATNTDQYNVTALGANAIVSAPSGTASDGQSLLIRIRDNGTSRTLSWNAAYRAGGGVSLPTATVVNKTMYIGLRRNQTEDVWDVVATWRQA